MRPLALLLILSVSTAFADEFAVFASGTRLRIDRHEIDGSRVRLYTTGGYTEMEASQVRTFEPEDSVPMVPTEGSAPAVSEPAPLPAELADAAADRYGLPRGLVRSVMFAESGLRPEAVSPKGAIGLMQLMPATAQALGADPRDPAQNVDAGARYLRDLLIRYNYGLWHALAAYNAGPGAVDLHNGVPPYRETIHYINRVERNINR